MLLTMLLLAGWALWDWLRKRSARLERCDSGPSVDDVHDAPLLRLQRRGQCDLVLAPQLAQRRFPETASADCQRWSGLTAISA